jgi:AraC-like DNA-binding protein
VSDSTDGGNAVRLAMSKESMALAVGDRHRPIRISAQRWSSSDGPWSGVPVECHVLGSRGRLTEFGIDHTLLGLCVKGKGTLQVDERNSRQRVRSMPGREPAKARLTVEPQYAISDPQVVSLVLNMGAEIQAGWRAGGFYGEALSLALAAYLFGRTSRRHAPATARGIALSPSQVRRVRDYVGENLGGDIGLSELASQTGLSPHYFSLLFKRAVGVSPYRYVLSTRIERAKRLLRERKMAMSEIALELGFADQSHFSKVFKTFAGATPRQYRSLY